MGNLIQRIDSAKKTWGMSLADPREDAGETATFSRSLEYIQAQMYEVQFPQRAGRKVLPFTSIPDWADKVTYRQKERTGKAKMFAHMETDDLPGVDLKGAEFSQSVYSFGASYAYSVDELRKAAKMQMNLDQDRSMAAREACEDFLDDLIWLGDTPTGLKGLPQASNILAVTKGAQASGTTWQDADGDALATPQEVDNDLNKMFLAIFNGSKGVHTPDSLLVGGMGYAFLNTRPQSPTFTAESIATWLLKKNPWLKRIEYCPKLDTVGASSKERIMLMQSGPQIASVEMAQDFAQLPPQARNFRFVVNCYMKSAGVKVLYPKAISYMDATQP